MDYNYSKKLKKKALGEQYDILNRKCILLKESFRYNKVEKDSDEYKAYTNIVNKMINLKKQYNELD